MIRTQTPKTANVDVTRSSGHCAARSQAASGGAQSIAAFTTAGARADAPERSTTRPRRRHPFQRRARSQGPRDRGTTPVARVEIRPDEMMPNANTAVYRATMPTSRTRLRRASSSLPSRDQRDDRLGRANVPDLAQVCHPGVGRVHKWATRLWHRRTRGLSIPVHVGPQRSGCERQPDVRAPGPTSGWRANRPRIALVAFGIAPP